MLTPDPLLRRVAGDSRIRDFPLVVQETVTVSAHADDISLFLRDAESFRIFLRTFSAYAALSRAQLNPGKSHALRFDSFRAPPPAMVPLVDAVRVLGVFLVPSGVLPRARD